MELIKSIEKKSISEDDNIRLNILADYFAGGQIELKNVPEIETAASNPILAVLPQANQTDFTGVESDIVDGMPNNTLTEHEREDCPCGGHEKENCSCDSPEASLMDKGKEFLKQHWVWFAVGASAIVVSILLAKSFKKK